jgi:hypothetical protein
MLIEFTRTGKQAVIPDKTARALMARNLVREVAAIRSDESEISPRTGKPKRQYRRRDMQAED